MRTLIIMMFLCLMSNTSLAMMNITEHMVGSAQEYGKSRTEETITAEEFQKPWTIHEVLGQNIYAVKEHIIIYTPYLLVAMDAQNKARAYEMIQPEAGKELADSFNGILVIGAVIDAPERITAEKLSSVLWQNGEEALPYHIELVAASSTEKIVNKTIKANNVGSKVEKNNEKNNEKNEVESISVKMPVWNLQYYLYFDLESLNATMPMTLIMSDTQSGERRFNFHLASMD